MRTYSLSGTCLVMLCLLLSTPGTAGPARFTPQGSMTVIGGESHAVDCFHAAGIAARIHYTSNEALATCTYALDYGRLSLRDRAATLVNRGIILMALEQYQAAMKDYDVAKRITPDYGEINVNMGNVFFLGKFYDRAIEEYTQAIEKKMSRDHIAYFNRGMAYEKLGDFNNAERDYQTARELSPEWSLPATRLELLQTKKASS